MEQISIRLQRDLLESLEQEADEQDKSRAEHIREVLKDRENTDEHERITDLENRIQELESELSSVRSERDRLLGKLEAKEDELEDLREWRDSAVGTLSRTPPVKNEDTQLVDAVEAEHEDSESDSPWWKVWR